MSKLDQALLDFAELEDPRLLDLPRGTRLLHVEATAWSARYHTDGHISRAALRRLTDEPDAALAAATLGSAGVWETTDTGWQIVGYLDRQLSAKDAQAKAKKFQERWSRQKARQRAHDRDDHSHCKQPWCPYADSTTDNTVSPHENVSTRIVSTRNDAPKEQVVRSHRAAARASVTQLPPSEKVAALDAPAVLEARAEAERYRPTWASRRPPAVTDGLEVASPVAMPSSVSVACDDYNAHRSHHRRSADGSWQCDACSKVAAL